MRRVLIVYLLLVVSCSQDVKEKPNITESREEKNGDSEIDLNLALNDSIESLLGKIGLVDIQTINENILVDLRYATKNNFMKVVLYDTLQKAFLQKEVALKLSECQKYLDSLRPGYQLKVFDGVRPLQVQYEMWNALDSIPRLRRGKFVSNPSKGSVHNFGAAVDLTIVDSKGKELDMGAGYDDFREIAFPKFEQQFLTSGELTIQQVINRKLLRKVMSSQGFRNIPSEWWHFNAYSRITTSHKFQMLISESGSSKWFRIIQEVDSTEVGNLSEE